MTFIGHIYFVSLNNGADRTIMQCTSNQNRHDIKHVKVAEAEANYKYNTIKYAQISISANSFSSLPNSSTSSCQAFEACFFARVLITTRIK
jgi:hypothetical protein